MHAQRGRTLLLLLSLLQSLNKMVRVLIVPLIIASYLVWVRAKCFMGWSLFQKVSEINNLMSQCGLGTLTLKKTNHKSRLHQHARLLSCTALIPHVLVGEAGLSPLALLGESSTLKRPINIRHQRVPIVLCPPGTGGATEGGSKEKASFLEGTARKLKMRPYCF